MPNTRKKNSFEENKLRNPEFVRLPKAGEFCPHCGLSRSALYRLVRPVPENGYKPPVKSVIVRQRGATRGAVLVSYDSLLNYLNSLYDGDEAA